MWKSKCAKYTTFGPLLGAHDTTTITATTTTITTTTTPTTITTRTPTTITLHYTKHTTPQLEFHRATTSTTAALHHTFPAVVGEVADQVTTTTIVAIPKDTAPTTFQCISGIALPSVIHNNQPLL